jgi:uncharacterized membrane protein YidH (DUF202 family)
MQPILPPPVPPPTPPSPPLDHHPNPESWLGIDTDHHLDTRSPTLPVPNPKLTSLTSHLSISISLKNQGGVARDHLSSERTFLAYVRTSLTIACTGVGTSFSVLDPALSPYHLIRLLALVQLFTISTSNQNGAAKRLQVYARPLGASTIILGVCVLLLGTFT